MMAGFAASVVIALCAACATPSRDSQTLRLIVAPLESLPVLGDARALGLRQETISRKMSDFQRRKWIRMTSLYRCRILNREALDGLAEGGAAEDADWGCLAH
jgi:hypothetical protein